MKLNLWTTVSSLNVANLPNILDYAAENNLDHDWAFLNVPEALDVKYSNTFTHDAKKKLAKSTYKLCRDISKRIAVDKDNSEQINLFIKKQDYLRKIKISNYFNLPENFSKNNSAKRS